MINLQMNNCYQAIIILLFFLTIPAQNIHYEEQDTFFTKLELQLRDDFKKCTGDTTIPKLKYLFEWKNRIHLQTQTEEYKEILKEYMLSTGILDSIVPCFVLSWHKSRMQFLKENETKVQTKVLEKSDHIVDSIGFLNEKKHNPESKFDFEGIPFGFSQKYFLKMYNEKFGSSPMLYDSIYVSEHFIYKETPYILRFYFNKEERLYKYEMESYTYSGNELNGKVRTAADLLKTKITEKVGNAKTINRIGYFDIKQEEPKLYTAWQNETIEANLYYAIKNDRYYTILKVSKKSTTKR